MPYPERFHQLAQEINNWGRWGDDDELGTLNLITDEVVKRAAGLVQHGKRISCALPLHLHGLQIGAVPGRVNPLKTMVSINHPPMGDPTMFCTSDDVVTMGLQAATHWDSLAHASYDGRMWNGAPYESVDVWGAHRNGIEKVKHLVGRGVLLDLARTAGVERLEGGTVIGPDELDAAAEAAKVTIEAGDIILLRTGWIQQVHAGDNMGYAFGSPGPGIEAAGWFAKHDVGAVATDNYVFEVYPFEDEQYPVPLHCLNIVEMGLTQGQNWDLEPLAADCADDGVHAFLLDASPQPFVGGCGSPVNPVAIK
jgi:kynurenine formamidase